VVGVNRVFLKMGGIFLTNWEKIILSKRTLLYAVRQIDSRSISQSVFLWHV